MTCLHSVLLSNSGWSFGTSNSARGWCSTQRFVCTRIEFQAVSAAATCRVGLLRQCTERYHRLQNREEAGGCGRRLTAAQVASKRADVQLPLAHWLYGLTWSCGFTVQSAVWSCAADHWGSAQSVSQKTTCTHTTPCSSTSRTKVRFVSHLQWDCACYIVCFTAFTKQCAWPGCRWCIPAA